MNRTTLAERAQLAERSVQAYLARVHDMEGRILPFGRWRERDPERLKVLSRLVARLRDLQRLLHGANLRSDAPFEAGADAADPALAAIAARLEPLASDRDAIKSIDVDAAWELADAIKQDLLYVADDHYLLMRLEAELDRERTTPEEAWSRHFPDIAISTIIDILKPARKPESPEPAPDAKPFKKRTARDHAIRRLCYLYDQRAAGGRSQRMLARMRTSYLRRLSIILALFLFAVGAMVYVLTLNPRNLHEFIVTILAGALGSTLAGVYKLRDATASIWDLRGFDAQFIAMPALGAAAAAVLFIFLRAGLVAFGPIDLSNADLAWLALAAFGFLAGLSEPFFLGTVERIAGGIRDSKKT